MTRKEYNKCVDDFADALFRFIVKSSHNKALADDIVQDSFLILWENVSEIACVKAKSFLFTTAYHKLIDTFRHEKKNADFENINPTSYLTEEKFTDLNEILEFALNKLPPIQKTVVLLSVIVKTCSDSLFSIGQKNCQLFVAKLRNFLDSHNRMVLY